MGLVGFIFFTSIALSTPKSAFNVFNAYYNNYETSTPSTLKLHPPPDTHTKIYLFISFGVFFFAFYFIVFFIFVCFFLNFRLSDIPSRVCSFFYKKTENHLPFISKIAASWLKIIEKKSKKAGKTIS